MSYTGLYLDPRYRRCGKPVQEQSRGSFDTHGNCKTTEVENAPKCLESGCSGNLTKLILILMLTIILIGALIGALYI
jgi:hypothetical protein